MSAQIIITDGTREAQVLDGWVDSRRIKESDTGVEIEISGRDKTADLVDCSAIVESSTWTSATLKKICDDILAPFGLTCEDYAENPDPLENFTIQNGDSAFSVIENACRARGVLPLSDRWGNLILVNSSGQAPAVEDIVRGVNLLDLEENHDETGRYSRYIVKGSANSGGDGHGWSGESVSLQGVATDSQVKRYRPLIVNAEGKLSAGTIKKRAAWEAQVRAGRSKEYAATVSGWIQGTENENSSFSPWEINQIARVKDDALEVDTSLLITGVSYSYDDAGEITTLTLKNPDTYKADPSGGIDV